jgi:hypothetical protein
VRGVVIDQPEPAPDTDAPSRIRAWLTVIIIFIGFVIIAVSLFVVLWMLFTSLFALF